MKNIEPIVLTESGNTLVTRSKSTDSARDITDETPLPFCTYVGIHDVCNGFLELNPCNQHYKVLCCSDCHLRIEFPNNVDTYGKLRAWCAENLKQSNQRRFVIDNMRC